MKRFISLMCVMCMMLTLILPASVLAEEGTYSVTTDEYVRYLGRGYVHNSYEGRSFNWPQSGFEFEFIGTKAEIFALMPSGTAYFNVSVDGGEPTRIQLVPGWNTICENLSLNDHVVKFVRSSEAIHGKVYINFLRVDGQAPSPTKEKERKIEIYGDSYTAGYGNVPQGIENEDVSAHNTDHWKGYASIIGRHYDADTNVIAFSGKGMAMNHNSGGTTTNEVNTIPMQFEYADIATGTGVEEAWDHSKYTPDLVIIFLGTNDFRGTSNMGSHGAYFQEKYEEFLSTLKTTYPTSKILCLSKMNTCYKEEAMAAVENAGGADAGIYHYTFKSFGESGIDAHPNAAEHESIANEVIGAINSIEGIWGDNEKKETIAFNSVTSNVVVAGEYKKGSGTLGQDVMLVLRKEGTTAADIAYIDQAKTDAYGNYAFKFKFDGNINDYKMYIKQGTNDITDTVVSVNNNMLMSADLSLNDANGGKVTFGIDTQAYLSARIVNYGADATKAVGVIAFYDAEGNLCGVETENLNVGYGVKSSGVMSADVPSQAVKAKAFVWKDITTLMPISNVQKSTQSAWGEKIKLLANQDIAVVTTSTNVITPENEKAVKVRCLTSGNSEEMSVMIVNGKTLDFTSGSVKYANYVGDTQQFNAGDVIVFTEKEPVGSYAYADTFARVADIIYPADDARVKSTTYTMTPFENALAETNSDVKFVYSYIKDIYGTGNTISLGTGDSAYIDDWATNQYYYRFIRRDKFQLSTGMYWMGRVDYEDTSVNPPLRTYVLLRVKDGDVMDIIALDSETRSN